MIGPTEQERADHVKAAQDLYPALFERVHALCAEASTASNVDVDHHAACVVHLMAKRGVAA